MFLNRPGFEAGPGCALHLHAMNTGQHFAETKPTVCWQLPLRTFDRDEEDDGSVTSVLTEFGREGWGEGGEEFAWWCTEAPEAFTAHEPVYRTMETELRLMLGDDVYDEIVKYCDARLEAGPLPLPHPAEVKVSLGRTRSDGRSAVASSEGGATGIADLLDDLTAEQRGLQDRLRAIDADAWLRPRPRAAGTSATRSRISPTPTRWRSRPRPARPARSTSAPARGVGRRRHVPGVLHGRRIRCRRARVVGVDQPRPSTRCSRRSIPTCASPGASGCARRRSSPRGSWRRGRTGSTCAPRSASSRSTPIVSRTSRGSRRARSPTPTPSPVASRRPSRCASSSPCRRAPWTMGPASAENRITGPAGEYCRVFVHRMKLADAPRLRADGPAATAALSVARAFL